MNLTPTRKQITTSLAQANLVVVKAGLDLMLLARPERRENHRRVADLLKEAAALTKEARRLFAVAAPPPDSLE
jgi:hypothetical protein